MGWFEEAINTASRAVVNPVGAALAPTAASTLIGYNALPNNIKAGAANLFQNGAVVGPGNAALLGLSGGLNQQGEGQQNSSPMMGSNAAARNADMEAGYAKGKELFYDDPDMQDLRNRRMDLSKGYDGQELGALRGQARSEIEGQRSNYLRSLAGKTARGGIGGARAAAMQASADKGFQQNRADMERKMTLDNANMVRQGTDSLQDFLMRQKYGTLGTGLGYAQLGVADRSADAQAAIAGKEQDRGIFGNILKPLFG